MTLGFEGFLAANVHLDLLGLGFGPLGKTDLKHAFVVVGAHLPRIYRTRECERAGKASVLPLDATEAILFLFLFEPAFGEFSQVSVLGQGTSRADRLSRRTGGKKE